MSLLRSTERRGRNSPSSVDSTDASLFLFGFALSAFDEGGVSFGAQLEVIAAGEENAPLFRETGMGGVEIL